VTLVVALLAAQAGTSPGSADEADTLIVGAQADELSTGGNGGGGQALWLHPLRSPGKLITSGVSYFTLAGTQWGYGRAGLSSPAGRRLSLAIDLSAGRGRTGGEPFDYNLYKGQLSCELYSKRLYGEAGLQYVDIAGRRGSVASAGVMLIPSTPIDLNLAYYRAVSANFESEFKSFRASLNRRRARLFGGLSLGNVTPEVFNVVGAAGGARSMEIYLGAEIPVREQKLMILGRHLDLGESGQRSIVLVWKVPLRPRADVEDR